MTEINKNIIITRKDLEDSEKYKYEVDRYGQFLFPNWVLNLGLSEDPLYIYIEMLSRLLTLSIKNNWIDKDDKVYIYYSNKELEKNLNRNDIFFNSEQEITKNIIFLIEKGLILKEEMTGEKNKYYLNRIKF